MLPEELPAPSRNHKGVIGDGPKTERWPVAGRERERNDADDGTEYNLSSLNIWEPGFQSPTLHTWHICFSFTFLFPKWFPKREEKKKGRKGEQGKNEYRNL